MIAASTALRLCFIVLFGAMNVMHGPVMTFSASHAQTAAAHDHMVHEQMGHEHMGHEHMGHAGHDGHPDHAPARDVACNAFACFMAIEPLPAAVRPVHAILFARLAAAPARVLDPIRAAPDLPPPRIQS